MITESPREKKNTTVTPITCITNENWIPPKINSQKLTQKLFFLLNSMKNPATCSTFFYQYISLFETDGIIII